MPLIDEEQLEQLAIDIFKNIGYKHIVGYKISPDGSNPERDDYRKVILEERLISSLKNINPDFNSQEIKNLCYRKPLIILWLHLNQKK